MNQFLSFRFSPESRYHPCFILTCETSLCGAIMTEEAITVRGARVNNLKNVSFSIPLNQLTVVTGVSGSGKTSLAFDTLYAEGQRRYVESLSAYARQFLERMDKPDVDEVRGIPPAIAIRQKNSTRNPRSTVATQTEIHDYLRLLFARIGTTICRVCGRAVYKDSPESAALETLSALTEGTRFYVLFPADAGLKIVTEETNGDAKKPAKKTKAKASTKKKKDAEYDKTDTAAVEHISTTAHVMSLMQRGFTRLLRHGEITELRTPDDFAHATFDETHVLVDRLAASSDVRGRLVDSLEIAFREGRGEAIIKTAEAEPRTLVFSERFECRYDGTLYTEPEPRLFSFNNPFGACPVCQGFGNVVGVDMDLVIPNQQLSLKDGAIEPFTRPQYEWAQTELMRFCQSEGISVNEPFATLTKNQQRFIIEGKGKWSGVRGFFTWVETKKYKLHVRVFLAKYRGYTVCHECHGGRLRQEARDVRVGNRTLPEISALSIAEAADFFHALELTEEQRAIAERVLDEIGRRLRFMVDVGLDYLTLARLASTLSGGEAQRIQLATSLGSALVGALYVLDEPSIGLHPRDGARLIALLERLRDIGNTLLVVEHDAEMMRAANHLLDVGPHAGELGGHIVYEGSFENLIHDGSSLTAKYLRGEAAIKEPKLRRAINPKRMLRVRGASEHNLQNVDVDVPLDMLTVITGVSGSGKSTLVHDVIYAGLKKQFGDWTGHVGAFAKLEGADNLDEVILVDQSPIGRTPRSNPVTYIKIYDTIREAFAATREAQARGLDASAFSFNVPGGRCDVCEGDGTVTVEMQFLADVELVCEECHGTRFKASTREVKLRGKSIHDVLQMTVREAMTFFRDSNKIHNRLKLFDAVGLGYLRLGQSATTLSGGEAQRVKLAAHLAKKSGVKTLYLFDEPTTGLHFDDINKLLSAFRSLVDAGGSLLVIEHNLDVIKTADYVIDIGPEGGAGGGRIVATGTPSDITNVPTSHTGQYLREHLARQHAAHNLLDEEGLYELETAHS